MFEYMQGYEIDGSDTSFNIVIPDRTKLREIAFYFLNLPIFEGIFSFEHFSDDLWAPHRNYRFEHTQSKEDILRAINDSSSHNGFFIVAECKHPDQLNEALKNNLLKLTNDRVIRHNAISEEKVDEYHNEHINPSIGYFDYTELNVALEVFLKKPEEHDQYIEPFGFVVNKDLFTANSNSPSRLEMDLTCGPSFIYEYAAYIILQLTERFPELSVSGGLDCENGFMNGCTYSTDLYRFERLLFTIDDSYDEFYSLVSNLFTKVVSPCKKVWKNRYAYHFEISDNAFSLFHASRKDVKNLDIKSYYAKILDIMKSDLTAERKINQSVAACSVYDEHDHADMWDRVSQLAVHTDKNKWLVELLVPGKYRKSVEALLKSAGIQYQ